MSTIISIAIVLRIKREREMFQTSMELWEAERRYQANVADRARGYERPGLTSLAEAEVNRNLSRLCA